MYIGLELERERWGGGGGGWLGAIARKEEYFLVQFCRSIFLVLLPVDFLVLLPVDTFWYNFASRFFVQSLPPPPPPPPLPPRPVLNLLLSSSFECFILHRSNYNEIEKMIKLHKMCREEETIPSLDVDLLHKWWKDVFEKDSTAQLFSNAAWNDGLSGALMGSCNHPIT